MVGRAIETRRGHSTLTAWALALGLSLLVAMLAATVDRADAAADDVIEVRLWGITGQERAHVWVDGVKVASRWAPTVAETWVVSAPVSAEVQVEFSNDGVNNDLWVNWVQVNGDRIETDSPTVHSVGTWKDGNCGPGYKQKEVLNCNGRFTYDFSDILGNDVIEVRLWGITGQERAHVWVDGVKVASRWAPTVAETWVVSAPVSAEVQVEFSNDGVNNDLWVNWVQVNGDRIETDSPSVHSVGTWKDGNCGPGYKQKEVLNCNGRFTYDFSGNNPQPDCIEPGGYVRSVAGECVGVPSNVSLVDYKSSMSDTDVHRINTAGAVIEGKRIKGCVVIEAVNVTFRNNSVECYASRDINNSWYPYPANNGPVTVLASAGGATIENNTLFCQQKSNDISACDYGVFLRGGNNTARFNDIFRYRRRLRRRGRRIGHRVQPRSRFRDRLGRMAGPRPPIFCRLTTPTPTACSSTPLTTTESPSAATTLKAWLTMAGLAEDGLQAVLAQKFSGIGGGAIVIEDNLISDRWTSFRIACIGGADCTIRNNTINAYYKVNGGNAINVAGSHSSTRVTCNRFTDGSLVDSTRVAGGDADNSGC